MKPPGINSITSTCWHIILNHFSIIFQKIGKEDFFYVYHTLNIHCNNVKKRLSIKLRCLIRKSDWSNSVNNNCFINLSSKVFSEDTKSSLGYGMNINVSNYHVNPTEITKGFVKLQKYNNLDASV